MLAAMGRDEVGEAGLATFTFLFTDVEGSTRRWQADPEGMRPLLASHDRVLYEAVEAHHGRVFKHTGDGICAVFASVAEGMRAAVDAQQRLDLPVRMALHTGEATERDGDYFGVALSRCARLLETGHGGQVLLSGSSAGVLGSAVAVRDLGEHRLRDLSEPERIFQALAPGLRDGFPALHTLDAARHNLPVVRSSFVGRERELGDVCERLEGEPLLTLTGIGGCGKTRLALEAAVRLMGRFPQGVFFVDLAVVSDPELTGQAVAGALGLQLRDTGTSSLAGYLEGRRVLIVFDNCEHLLDTCAELADGLLSRSRELRILATSREPLGVEGEQVFRVPSLSIETDAVRLFFDRARAVGAHLDRDTSSDEAVVEICRRLDGIPLAIELAAARSAHLGAVQILERLSDRFRLLTGGRRRVQRQQTLAAAIDWSHDLLSPVERKLFRRLAVFKGSFSLAAAEEICGAGVDVLGSLVDKSLVNVQHDDAVPRYRLIESVRLYAEQRLLDSGEAADVRSAHRDWFLAWVDSFPIDELVGVGGGRHLIPEADNLAAALEWSLEQDRLDLVARLAARMASSEASDARLAEVGRWWRALEKRLGELSADLRAQALLVGTDHVRASGDFEQMERLSAAVLAIAEPDSWVAACAWSFQALYWTYADPQRGRRCIEEGCRAAAAAGLPKLGRGIAMWSANLLTGDPGRDEQLEVRAVLDNAVALIEQGREAYFALGIIAALGDTDTASRLASSIPATAAFTRFNSVLLATVIAIREGRTYAALESLRTLARIVREYAIALGEASCLVGFAALAATTGDLERASRLLASVKGAAPFPFRTPVEALLYRQTVRTIRDGLGADVAARCRADGATMQVTDALDAELTRLRDGRSTVEPADKP